MAGWKERVVEIPYSLFARLQRLSLSVRKSNSGRRPATLASLRRLNNSPVHYGQTATRPQCLVEAYVGFHWLQDMMVDAAHQNRIAAGRDAIISDMKCSAASLPRSATTEQSAIKIRWKDSLD